MQIKAAGNEYTVDNSNWVSCQSHCAKVQKYNRAKQVSNFLICGTGTNNTVEHYEKRMKILHQCPVLFLTEEIQYHDGLRSRELGQAPILPGVPNP